MGLKHSSCAEVSSVARKKKRCMNALRRESRRGLQRSSLVAEKDVRSRLLLPNVLVSFWARILARLVGFDVEVKDVDGRAELVWSKVNAWRDWSALSEGCYLLRSNITDWSAEDLWKAYIQLTQAEAAFRIHKSDLSIRPIWHQKKERVQAHILVCFLAFVLWKTLGQMCRAAGLGNEPRKVLDEISQIQMVDVVMPTKSGVNIRRRCIAQPTKHQAILLQRLGLTLPTHLKVHEV